MVKRSRHILIWPSVLYKYCASTFASLAVVHLALASCLITLSFNISALIGLSRDNIFAGAHKEEKK
jgi:hypothetical protein